MTRVKICGITNLADARLAADLGADALGFIFYPASKRAITQPLAAEIIRALPPFVHRVGVFVNESPENIRATIAACRLTAVQLHGDEPPDFCGQFPVPVIKAVRVRDETSLALAEEYAVDALLFDTYRPGTPGGTGQVFNWTLMVAAKRFGRPVILSGGLTPANVREAIRVAQPYAVDVASGVEREPGRKDPDQLRRFIEACRED